MNLRLKDRPLLAGFLGGILAISLLAIAGAQPSLQAWATAKFVSKGPVISADSTANNIVGSTTSAKVPLVVQQRTGATVDAFNVYANGATRFKVDTNGTAVLNGAQIWKRDAITPAASTGTQIPVARYMVAVADAAGASRFVQLQAASTVGAGYAVLVVDTPATAATNNITITRAGSDTITTTTTGNTTCTIATNGGAALFISDGTSVWKRFLLAG